MYGNVRAVAARTIGVRKFYEYNRLVVACFFNVNRRSLLLTFAISDIACFIIRVGPFISRATQVSGDLHLKPARLVRCSAIYFTACSWLSSSNLEQMIPESTSTGGQLAFCCFDCSCQCKQADRYRLVLTILAILFGIFDLVTDWMAFISFASEGFVTSPIGDANDGLRILWISIIVPSTVLSVADLAIKIAVLCKFTRKQLHTYDPSEQTLFRITMMSFGKVLIEDGGNVGVGWYVAILACTVKTSSSSDSELKTQYWLLAASWIVSCISAITSLIQLCQTYNTCCRRFKMKGRPPGSFLNLCLCRITGFMGGLIAAGLVFMVIGVIFVSSTGAGALLVEGDEVSIYIESDTAQSSSNGQFLANFSAVYSRGEQGLEQSIDRKSLGCYVYKLKFDSEKRLVLYNYAVFGSSTCSQCQQATNSTPLAPNYESPTCDQDRTRLMLALYEYKKQDRPLSSLTYCISDKSKEAMYSADLQCPSSSAGACYRNAVANDDRK